MQSVAASTSFSRVALASECRKSLRSSPPAPPAAPQPLAARSQSNAMPRAPVAEPQATRTQAGERQRLLGGLPAAAKA